MVHSLVFDIPSPPPGMTKVVYDYSGLYKVEFELNPINKIPKAGSDLKEIFDLLGIRKVIEILKYIILEVPVIFFCQDKLTLSNVVKSCEEMIFPFNYPYSVIPVLPKTYFKCLEKLSCFIVGINQRYDKDFFEINKINLNDKEYAIVSLSEQVPDSTFCRKNMNKYGILLKDFNKPMQKNRMIEKYLITEVNFPKHYQTKLLKNLHQLFYGKNSTQNLNREVKNEDIRYQLYYFFTSMLQHYKSFINIDNKLISLYQKVENDTIDLNELFKFQEFILKAEDSIDFYNFFISTKIWRNFLLKKIYPFTIEEKLEVLLLDEYIRKKKNKNMLKQLFKENTPFLETNKFDIKNTELIKIEYDKEQEMHLDITTGEDLEKSFPLLDKEKMETIYDNNFLLSNVKIKNLYQEFYKECENIIKDKKFLDGYNSIGYKLNINEEVKTNYENYILKLWYLLICYVFKYLDNGDKSILFNELIKQIQSMSMPYKVCIIDPFISELMFTTFIEYGDKQMCSLLYKELNDIPNVKEDYLTFTQLHKKFINKKEEFKLSLPKEIILKEKNFNLFNIPNNEKMKIILISLCECGISSLLKLAILNFSSMNSDKITYKCSICKKISDAIFTVSLGEGLNQKYYYHLYTPKYLFYYIKNLGDFNINNFFEEHTEIFFNLIILFQLRENSYDFLFPYKDKKLTKDNKPYIGFNPDFLEVKKTGENKYIYKNPNANKQKWYEAIIPSENQLKQRRFSKIIPSRRGSVKTFKTFEPLSSSAFFKKNLKKKEKSNFSYLKYSKTINES